MSGCIPFPPPRHVWKGARGDSLIELMKAKREKTEPTRERTEKRRRMEEEEEELEEGEIRESKRHTSSSHECSKKKIQERDDNGRKKKDGVLEMDRSSATEELELPISNSLHNSSGNSIKTTRKGSCCSTSHHHASFIQKSWRSEKIRECWHPRRHSLYDSSGNSEKITGKGYCCSNSHHGASIIQIDFKDPEEKMEEGEIRESKLHRRHSHESGKKEIQERDDNGRRQKDEVIEMGRSNVTGELEQPISDSLHDSSGNSKKITGKGYCCSTSHHHASFIQKSWRSEKIRECWHPRRHSLYDSSGNSEKITGKGYCCSNSHHGASIIQIDFKDPEEKMEEGEIRESKLHRRHSHESGKKEIQERDDNGRRQKDEVIEMGRSNVTGELEQPISDSLHDSSGNSKKITGKGYCCSTSHHHASFIQKSWRSEKIRECWHPRRHSLYDSSGNSEKITGKGYCCSNSHHGASIIQIDFKDPEEKMEEGEIRESKLHRRHSHESSKKEIQERDDNGRRQKDEVIEMGRSNVTEELEHPISDSLHDSSGNSKKITGKGYCCSTSHHRASIIQIDYKDPEEELEAGEIRESKHHESSKKEIQERDDNGRKQKDEVLEMDRSNVTEDLKQPISNHLYDSSGNSEKTTRKGYCCSTSHHYASIIPIDFKDPEKKSRRSGCSSTTTDSLTKPKTEASPASSFSENGGLQTELQLIRDLFANWVPPLMKKIQEGELDEDWLHHRRLPMRCMRRTSDSKGDELSNGSFDLYPRAAYLSHAGIHALPYTIPF